MSKKNVLYGVSNFGGDMGGHLRSLKSILQEMAAENKVNIYLVLFSLKTPKEGSYSFPTPHFHIISNGLSGLRSVRRMRKDLHHLFAQQQFDIIHAFDSNAYYFLKSLSDKRKVPIVLTKCGGNPAPKWKYPSCRHMTLFSVEDLVNFKSQARFQKSSFHLIPNRVKAPVQDQALIAQLKAKYSGGFDFLRISRFARLHEHSLMQSVDLVKYLRAQGIHKRLLILGGVEDEEVYNKVKASLEDGMFLETEEAFCKEASKIIEVADIVIGSGRGLMEAAALGKVLLAPNKNLTLPVLVEEKSFDNLFHHNFSGRTKFDAQYAAENERNLVALASGKDKERFAGFSRQMFAEHFDIKNGIPKYLSVYDSAAYERQPDLIGSIAHAIVITKRFLKK